MDEKEFLLTYDTMLDDAVAIIHNQQVLSGIQAELDKNILNPFEQDFIYHEHYGKMPAEPKILTSHGVRIISRVLHQTGYRLSDIRGADMLYEIENEKFIMLQYKRATNYQVSNDKSQLETMLRNCPGVCSNIKWRPFKPDWIPIKAFTFCGYWYRVINGTEIRNVTACEAENIFQGQSSQSISSFQLGLSEKTFLELFTSCRIGALLKKPNEIKSKDIWVNKLVNAGDFILSILQTGLWRRK